MTKPRNYKKEYKTYHGTPAQVAARSNRNKARRTMEKAGKVSKGDGKEVDHKNGNPMVNKGNLQVLTRTQNRKKGG